MDILLDYNPTQLNYNIIEAVCTLRIMLDPFYVVCRSWLTKDKETQERAMWNIETVLREKIPGTDNYKYDENQRL